MTELPILFDLDPGELVAICRDPAGVPVDLIELTGMRTRDISELRTTLRADVVASFAARPERRRLIVWSDAAWLQEHAPEEYDDVRAWLTAWVREIQNPWQLPPTGQVGVVVLAGALPDELAAHRAVPLRDLDYEAPRPPERRARPRNE